MGGRAHGKDRDYQVLCRDLLRRLRPELVAYARDGIDIPFVAGRTTITVDVALRDPEEGLVLVECKRQSSRVDQGEMMQFSRKLEKIRKATGLNVAGIFMAKRGVQLGASGEGKDSEIEVVQCNDRQPLPGFGVCFVWYDDRGGRRRQRRDYIVRIFEDVPRVSASWHSVVNDHVEGNDDAG